MEEKNDSNEMKSHLCSPRNKFIGSSSKRSKREAKSLETHHTDKGNKYCEIEGLNIDNVTNQVTVETMASAPFLNIGTQRIDFINSQKNRYSSINFVFFLIHVESVDDNIGNLHSVSLREKS